MQTFEDRVRAALARRSAVVDDDDEWLRDALGRAPRSVPAGRVGANVRVLAVVVALVLLCVAGVWAFRGRDSSDITDGTPALGVIGHGLQANDEIDGFTAEPGGGIWTVGYVHYGRPQLKVGYPDVRPLAARWVNGHWTTFAAPRSVQGNLLAIDAGGPNDAWAVGAVAHLFAASEPLLMHWDGTSWEQFPIQGVSRSTALTSVVVVGPDDVWAIGTSTPSRYGRTAPGYAVLVHWDGTHASEVPGPEPGHTHTTTLNAVAAVDAADVWSVGFSTHGHGSMRPFAEHWNGREWAQVPCVAPEPHAELTAISAVSADDIWATGEWDYLGTVQPFLEHWDGTRWSTVQPPRPPGEYTFFLTDIAAHTADDVWALGRYSTGTRDLPVAEHFDGRRWTIVSGSGAPAGLSGVDDLADSATGVLGLALGSGQRPRAMVLRLH